jgi:hypothetical protein
LGSQSPIASATVQAIATAHRSRDADVQRRLDAFMARATPTYRTPWGEVTLPTPFRLRGLPSGHDDEVVVRNEPVVRHLAVKTGLDRPHGGRPTTAILDGRGTPEQVRRLTQALIDAGRLLPPTAEVPIKGRVQQMMFDYGIGFDCAGFVGQAYAASRSGAVTRAPALDPQDALAGLGTREFARVGLDETRPGDIIVLGRPPHEKYGHTVIVYGAHEATDADRKWLGALAGDQVKDEGQTASAHNDGVAAGDIASSANLRVMVVDSSWGSGGAPTLGGVQRRTWIHDLTRGQWVWTDCVNLLHVTATPYDHPIQGAYRPVSER